MVFHVKAVGLGIAYFPVLSDQSVFSQSFQGFLYGFIVEFCRVRQHADRLLGFPKRSLNGPSTRFILFARKLVGEGNI